MAESPAGFVSLGDPVDRCSPLLGGDEETGGGRTRRADAKEDHMAECGTAAPSLPTQIQQGNREMRCKEATLLPAEQMLKQPPAEMGSRSCRPSLMPLWLHEDPAGLQES
ncbi:unnamed protein product [Caretta caretta]